MVSESAPGGLAAAEIGGLAGNMGVEITAFFSRETAVVFHRPEPCRVSLYSRMQLVELTSKY